MRDFSVELLRLCAASRESDLSTASLVEKASDALQSVGKSATFEECMALVDEYDSLSPRDLQVAGFEAGNGGI